MELQTPRIYGIKNKAGNIGTLHLLKTQQAINDWREDLTKQKKSLLEDKEHFNEKLTIYKEIYNKIKDKDGNIKKQIEQNEKVKHMKYAKFIIMMKNKKKEYCYLHLGNFPMKKQNSYSAQLQRVGMLY